MKRNIGLVLSGMVAMVVSGSVLADTDAEILERIQPIGKVNVEQPAAPAPEAAPAAEPAPAVAEAVPAPAEPAAEAAPAPETAAAAPAAADGKKTYDSVCFVCHLAGISNAPKLGDKAAWEPRIAKGMDTLMQSSINGIPGTAMPPRGTCAACSDDELKAAVEYMISSVQ